jgi:hypothetical protein
VRLASQTVDLESLDANSESPNDPADLVDVVIEEPLPTRIGPVTIGWLVTFEDQSKEGLTFAPSPAPAPTSFSFPPGRMLHLFSGSRTSHRRAPTRLILSSSSWLSFFLATRVGASAPQSTFEDTRVRLAGWIWITHLVVATDLGAELEQPDEVVLAGRVRRTR